jgi:sialate O-acetylesterase
MMAFLKDCSLMKMNIAHLLAMLFLGTLLAGSRAEKIRVACIGDSITYGRQMENRDATYPSQLQILLGDRYEVRNFGSSGRGIIKSSKRGKVWRAFIKHKKHPQALDFNPHVVVCNLGINDIDDYRNGHADEFVPDYVELIRAYQELPSNPKIFIWTKLAPLFETQKHYRWEEPFVMRLDLERVAAETGAVGLDLFSGLVGQSDLFLDDSIHPNKEGYKVIAQQTSDQLQPYLTGDFGGLKIPYVYGDHMVLQREKELYFHGTANAGQSITVRFAGQEAETTTGADGRWEVRLQPMQAGGPYQLEIEAESTIAFTDVMVGEVWIAAGQSNMQWPLSKCLSGKEEIPDSANSEIRLLNRQRTIPGGKAPLSEENLARCSVGQFYEGEWAACSPETAKAFSGVAYYFAKTLQKELQVPVGIINVPIGGTICEAFTSEQALLKNPHLRGEVACNDYWVNNENVPEWPRGRAKQQFSTWLEKPKGPFPGHPFEPSFLYKAAIAPLGEFGIRGSIWYQGESNATGIDSQKAMPKEYVRAGLETLILDWRQQFQQGDFPFYYAQLPGLNRNWMTFREMQLDVSRDVPNTGMIVTIDVGHPTNVHPKNKQPVGERLGNLALAKTYGKAVAYSGPVYRELNVDGNQARVVFDFSEGLQPAQGTAVIGFEIAGEDGVYYQARAKIDGDSVILRSIDVSKPVIVRYGWKANPDGNLVNSEKLPTSPFMLRIQ